MKTTFVLSGIALATLFSSCTTSTTQRYPDPPSLEAQFAKADVNGDGKVSRQEYGKLLIDEMAIYFDANGDGVVTKNEFVALGGDPEAFDRLDQNGDGKLTAAEVKMSDEAIDVLTVAFVGADQNKDGYVTLEEAKAYRKAAAPYFR